MSFNLSPLFGADSYKFGHINFYPEGITEVYSNFTPRSVKHLRVPAEYKKDFVVWVGAQAVIQDMFDMWNEQFFSLVDDTNKNEKFTHSNLGKIVGLSYSIQEFSRIIAPFAGADYTIEHLKSLHKLGYLPLEIKTLPEGSLVPVGIPVLTVRNTLPEFYWLTNFIESYLSAELWKMSTSATIAWYYRQIGNKWYDKTGANKGFLDFAFHDFSYRGMSGSMDAVKSGVGHLVNFKGTDTVPAIPYIEYHYSGKDTFIGASVPATEHSIQTAFVQNDYEYIRSMIQDKVPSGIVSVVADGYDYWAVLTDTLPKLKDVIMNRKPDAMGFAKTVIRPDSGDPVEIICGTDSSFIQIRDEDELHDFLVDSESYDGKIFVYQGNAYLLDGVEDYIREYGEDNISQCNGYNLKYFLEQGLATRRTTEEYSDAERKGSVEVLWELFGGTVNEKGYKVLDPHIGLIYGDSITLERADEILKRLEEKGFSAENVVFGVGSYTYQYNTRDTLGFAMKATNITKDGVDIPLFKDPKTDDGTKKSAKGLLMVDWNIPLSKAKPQLSVYDNQSRENERQGELTTLFKDGKFLKHETFEEIRNRLLGA